MHSDSKKRRSFVALLFAAGDLRRWKGKMNSLSKIKIRDFSENDLSSVTRLIHNTIDSCYIGLYPPLAVEYFKEFHSPDGIKERSKSGKILVFEDAEKKIIGTGAVVETEIYGVFVHPKKQNFGLGKIIMENLESVIKSNGNSEAKLSVSLPSRQFYENLGYIGFEEATIDVGNGQQLDYWIAWKHLQS